MREKSDKRKKRDGRGIIAQDHYEAWKTARESKSSGTACAVYDPIQHRTVNLLSQGEVKVFWTLRFFPEIQNIYEQVPLRQGIVDAILLILLFDKYGNINGHKHDALSPTILSNFCVLCLHEILTSLPLSILLRKCL